MSADTFFYGNPIGSGTDIANGLLQIRAVELRPNDLFTWSSGWKSPIYCDNRLVLSYPVLRDMVIDGFQATIQTAFPGLNAVVGTATAGIAHAAIVADRLGLPTAYVRSSAKAHGKQKRTEGRVEQGDRVVVIEDTLSTGNSAYSAVEALQDDGVEVLGVLAIVSYDFEVARARAAAVGVPAYRLVEYSTLVQVAVDKGYISPHDVDMLMTWREAPQTFGQ